MLSECLRWCASGWVGESARCWDSELSAVSAAAPPYHRRLVATHHHSVAQQPSWRSWSPRASTHRPPSSFLPADGRRVDHEEQPAPAPAAPASHSGRGARTGRGAWRGGAAGGDAGECLTRRREQQRQQQHHAQWKRCCWYRCFCCRYNQKVARFGPRWATRCRSTTRWEQLHTAATQQPYHTEWRTQLWGSAVCRSVRLSGVLSVFQTSCWRVHLSMWHNVITQSPTDSQWNPLQQIKKGAIFEWTLFWKATSESCTRFCGVSWRGVLAAYIGIV